MPIAALLLTMGLIGSPPADVPLEQVALKTSLATCDTWITNPASWADHVSQFPKRSGLGTQGLKIESGVPGFAAAPAQWRTGVHYWSVKQPNEAVWITTSDVLPVCHFASDAPDAAPALEALIASPDFTALWSASETGQEDIRTTVFHRVSGWKGLVLVVTRHFGDEHRDASPQIIVSEQLMLGNH